MVLHDFAYAEICFDGYKRAEHPRGAGREGRRDRVPLALEEPLDGRLARRLRVRQPRDDPRARAHQELPRLRHAAGRSRSARSWRCAARRTASPRTCDEYRERRDALIDGLGAPGDGAWKIEKPLGTMFVWAQIPEPFRGTRLDRVQQAPDPRGEGGGVARARLRRERRGLRALRAGRERAPHPPGRARHPRASCATPAPAPAEARAARGARAASASA